MQVESTTTSAGTILDMRRAQKTELERRINEAADDISKKAAGKIKEVVQKTLNGLSDPVTAYPLKNRPCTLTFNLESHSVDSIFDSVLNEYSAIKNQLVPEGIKDDSKKKNGPEEVRIIQRDAERINSFLAPIIKKTASQLRECLTQLIAEERYQCFSAEVIDIYYNNDSEEVISGTMSTISKKLGYAYQAVVVNVWFDTMENQNEEVTQQQSSWYSNLYNGVIPGPNGKKGLIRAGNFSDPLSKLQ